MSSKEKDKREGGFAPGCYSSSLEGKVRERILWCRLFAFSILVVFFAADPASAQSYLDEPGIPSFTTSFPVEYGFINLANGNLHIEIPIATYPQRGNIKALHVRLVYDSRFWVVVNDPVSEIAYWGPNGVGPSGVAVGGGFRLITDGEPGNSSFSESTQQCGCTRTDDTGHCISPVYKTTFAGYAYQDPDGTTHRTASSFKLYSMPGTCPGGPLVPTGTTYATDNSGYKFVITDGAVAVYAPDGTQVLIPPSGGQPTPPGSPMVQDTNGNFSSYSPGQNSSFTNTVDTLGRTLVVTTFSGSQAFLDYLCEPGSSGCDPTTNRARVTLNNATPNWTTQFNQTLPGAVREYSGPGSALTASYFLTAGHISFSKTRTA